MTGIGSFLVPLLLHFSTIMSAPDSVKAAVKAASKAPPALVLLIALGTSLSLSPGQRSTPLSRAVSHVQVGGLTGCATLFPGLQTGTVSGDINAFITVATSVSSWAADAWALVPASLQSSASAVYTVAQATLKGAVQLAQDGLAAYLAGSGPVPNWAGLISAIDSAIDAVVAEVQTLSTTSPNVAAAVTVTNPTFAFNLSQLKAAQATAHRFHAP